MSWMTAFLPSGPRRRHISEMDEIIQRNEDEVMNLQGTVKNNLQAVQSGTRVLDTMSSMLRLVTEAKPRVDGTK